MHAMAQELIRHLKTDPRSSSEIARLAKVSQPTVSRLRHTGGTRQRMSQSFNKLCNFYKILQIGHGDDSQHYNAKLQKAIIEAWDGTEAGGKALLVVIQGLKELNTHLED